MQALLVIDVQNGLVNNGDFTKELSRMENMIKDFQKRDRPVIFMQHFDDTEESELFRGSSGSDLHSSLKEYAEHVIPKTTPSSFHNTELTKTLEKFDVNHLFITGFSTEYCCMFTGIAAYDRGYKVTFIEDATATPNTDDTYEMKGLDILDFVGTVLVRRNRSAGL